WLSQPVVPARGEQKAPALRRDRAYSLPLHRLQCSHLPLPLLPPLSRVSTESRRWGLQMMIFVSGHAAGRAALALLGTVLLGAPALADDFDRRWGPSVELGGRISDGRSIGETSLF